ncbi:MAG TPA: hypothetical protein VF011_16015 [Terriglobales bacterium]
MKSKQRGIALLMALFALLLLTGIGFGLLYMSDAETAINSNYRSSQQAYFNAMAGLQNVRERMTPANVAPHLIDASVLAAPGNANSIWYVMNPASGNPWAAGNADSDPQVCGEYQNITGACPAAANTLLPAIQDDTAAILGNANYTTPYRWVRIERKVNASNAPYFNSTGGGVQPTTPTCWNGASELPLTSIGDPNCSTGPGSDPPGHTQVYVLTSFATTPGGASRVLQMEVAQDPPLVTHGAVDSQDHVNLNGALTVNGYDYCSCTCTTTGNGGNQQTTCTNRVTGAVAPTCDQTHYAIYSASTVQNPNNSETVIAGTTNPQNGQNMPIDQNAPWTWDTNELLQRFSTDPNAKFVTSPPYSWSCSGGSCGTQSGQTLGVPPTFPPNPPVNPVGPANMSSQITIVPGNLQLTGGSVGNGVLVVNGNLDIHGGLQFYGLIIVTGVISFTGGGSSATNIYGAVIAGQQSYVDNTLGGSANISFDFCSLPGGSRTQPPRALAMRDINF